jgi:hypothetical protein
MRKVLWIAALAVLLVSCLTLASLRSARLRGALLNWANTEGSDKESFYQHTSELNETGSALMSEGADYQCVPNGVPMRRSALLVASNARDANACMLNSLDHVILKQSGGCSKSNAYLYRGDGSGDGRVVRGISTQDGTTGIAKCVIDVHEDAPPELLEAYDRFLRDMTAILSPRGQRILARIEELKRRRVSLEEAILKTRQRQKDTIAATDRCHAELREVRSRLRRK